MSKRFNYDDSNKSFLYTGYEGYTTEPDWVYSDEGVIKYLDDVKTGFKFESECEVYYDYSVIKFRS